MPTTVTTRATEPKCFRRRKIADYSRLQKFGMWMKDDVCWMFICLWFGVGGRSCSNFLASTVNNSPPITGSEISAQQRNQWYRKEALLRALQFAIVLLHGTDLERDPRPAIYWDAVRNLFHHCGRPPWLKEKAPCVVLSGAATTNTTQQKSNNLCSSSISLATQPTWKKMCACNQRL